MLAFQACDLYQDITDFYRVSRRFDKGHRRTPQHWICSETKWTLSYIFIWRISDAPLCVKSNVLPILCLCPSLCFFISCYFILFIPHVFPPLAAPRRCRHSRSSNDPCMWFGIDLQYIDLHFLMQPSPFSGLGPAIRTALACASPVTGEQTGVQCLAHRHTDCRTSDQWTTTPI